jgi:hypothetical protein
VLLVAGSFAFLIATPARGQTTNTNIQAIQQLNLGVLSILPQPLIDPTTDPPGNFTNVIPHEFDPGRTNLVQSSWLSGIGCPTNGFLAIPNSTFTGVSGTMSFTDSACLVGDPKDQRTRIAAGKDRPDGKFRRGDRRTH